MKTTMTAFANESRRFVRRRTFLPLTATALVLTAIAVAMATLLGGAEPADAQTQQPGDRLPSRDVFLDNSSDESFFAFWSDGTKVWLYNDDSAELLEYSLSSGGAGTAVVSNLLTTIYGIWTNDTTMWLLANEDATAYNLSDFSRNSSKDITFIPGNYRGLWSDGTTMFSVRTQSKQVVAVNLSDGTPRANMDFNLRSGNDHPADIWSDGEHLWVWDEQDHIAYAYELNDSGATSAEYLDLDLSSEAFAAVNAIWSDAGIFWVANQGFPSVQLIAFTAPLPVCRETAVISGSGRYTDRDSWRSDCAIGTNGANARHYTFTLAERREVHITLSSSDTVRDPELGALPKFAPHLYLREGDNALGDYLDQSGDSFSAGDPVRLTKVLDAGTYTAEATNFNPGETGSFNFAITTRTLTDPPTTTGDVPASCHTISLEQGGTYTGEWGPGPAHSDISCFSEASDGYARFYDFHLTNPTRVTITLESDNATPRLFLSRKMSQHWQIQAGVPNEDRWLSPDWIGQYSNGDSRISETLYAGSYTIWAASNEAGQRGDFTLRVQGSGITKVPELPAAVLCANTPDQTLTEGVETAGQWGPGCESVAFDNHFARLYRFAVSERKRVTITLKDKDFPTSGYGFVLRRGASVEASRMERGERWPAQDFDTLSDAGNNWPRGMFSDGKTLWVADTEDDKIYAYKLDGKTRDADRDLDLTGDNADPWGIWSDGETMWVSDTQDDKVYAYQLSDGSHVSANDITLDDENGVPLGIWSDGTTIWVVDDGSDDKVYAYTLGTGARDEGKEFDLAADNGNPRGVWSDGTTIWVVDDGSDDKVYAYSRSNGGRISASDLALHADNGTPVGIWSNGATMWVADAVGDKIYAYVQRTTAYQDHIQWGSIMGGGSNESTQATFAMDVGQGQYLVEAFGSWPSEFTIKYDVANPSSDSNCHGRTIRENQEVEGRWFNDCASSATGKYAAYYNLNVSGAQTKRLNIRLRSIDHDFSDPPTELRLWSADSFTGSGTNRTLKAGATPLAAHTDGRPHNRANLHVDLQRGNYVIEAVNASIRRTGKFRLGVTTGVEPPEYVRQNCGEIKHDLGVLKPNFSKAFVSRRAESRTDNHNDANHADYLPFGNHGGDQLFRLGQNHENLAHCTGDPRDGWPVWHFVFDLEKDNQPGDDQVAKNIVDVLLSRNTFTSGDPPDLDKNGAAWLSASQLGNPSYTLRQIGGYVTRDANSNQPFNKWSYVRITDAPAIDCVDSTTAPCDASKPVQHTDLEPGTYALTVTMDPPTSAPNLWIRPGPFQVNISVLHGSRGPLEGGSSGESRSDGESFQGELSGQSNQTPAFDDGIATTLTLVENSLAGTDIGAPITATDPDGDALTYSLSGAGAGSFGIDPATGQIATIAGVAYDYETRSSYSLTVNASDGNGGEADTPVTVNLTDVSEPPEFHEGEATTREVAENSPPGTNVGNPVAAFDSDGHALAYIALDGADGAAFALDENTGQITTIDGVNYDYETKSSYKFMLIVMELDSDVGYMTGIDVTVNLTDVDETPDGTDPQQQQQSPETPTNRAPNFDDGIVTTLALAENSPAGTDIGSPITATDPDGDALAYSLSGTDAASFEIGGTTGQIATKAGADYDYESKSSYSLAVNVSDGNGGEIGTPVTVNLTDVNEAPAFASASATRQVAENSPAGTSVGASITATDPDGDALTYSLSGADAASFGIDAATGQIATIAGVAYDYETKSSYSLTAEAVDAGGMSASIAVTVNLTDVVEATSEPEPVNQAPSFTEGTTATRSVAENSVAGTNVGPAVTATDPDSGDTLAYSLSGTDAASFEIGGTTGQITTKSGVTYDYEGKSSYSLTVEVSDGNGGAASIAVTVNLTDVDEAIPVTACETTIGSLSAMAEYAGRWDDAECKAHHQDSLARYFQFTLPADTTVSVSLTSGSLYVSKGTPKNGWGTEPGGGYDHRKNVRRGNGKLVHDGSNTATLALKAGETYTVEAAGSSGEFTVNIGPQ